MLTLKDRTAALSGADPVVVQSLLKQGMRVALLTHNMERAEKEIQALGELGKNCIAVQCEADDPQNTADAYRKIISRFGSLDVIIPAHTGAPKQKKIEEYTASELNEIFGVVVGGSFNMVLKALPYLEKSRAPRIILIASSAALYADQTESLSRLLAHGAILALTRNLALRLAEKGITVNCIAKGGYPERHAAEQQLEQIRKAAPLHRAGSSDDLAAAISYLASEEASFVTGEILMLDGGMHIG